MIFWNQQTFMNVDAILAYWKQNPIDIGLKCEKPKEMKIIYSPNGFQIMYKNESYEVDEVDTNMALLK